MKGIAIQTVLLLLVGILVVGIVVYMVYRYTSSQALSEAECKSRISNICMHCQIGGWINWPNTATNPLDEKFYQEAWDCAAKFPNSFGEFAKGNLVANPWTCTRMKDPCKIFGYT